MCGILAALGFEPPPAALDLVAHRGPDGQGWASFGSPGGPVVLGHRRLAVIDLSDGGRQPMATPDGRYWLIYNGELYNYRELREELRGQGWHFRSESDSEVLLAAYAQWGRDCLPRFNGMFAFAVWDDTEKRLFAARDRFGVKPLYWWAGPHGLALASEIKQLTVLDGFRARADEARLVDFLAWGLFDHGDGTLFDAVHQLRGGEWLEAEAADGFAPRTGRWYELAPATDVPVGDEEEAAARLRTLIEDAVALQLRSDVPVGSCLSGGIDSSGIVCLLEALRGDSGAARHAFAAVFSDPEADERRFVDMVERATDAEIHRVAVDEGAMEHLAETVLWHQDEPYGSTSMLAQWAVFEAAAGAGVKVMLDGQGADELFAGYPPMLAHHHAELLRRRRLAALWRALSAERGRHGVSFARQAALLIVAAFGSRIARGALRLARHPAAAPWIHADRLDGVTAFEATAGAGADDLVGLRRTMATATSIPMLLHYEDRASMAHGIEARVPYLDHRLAEFALALPPDMLVRDARTKWLLRRALRGAVPAGVLERDDKLGFATPERRWMTGPLAGWCRRRAARMAERRPDMVDANAVSTLLEGGPKAGQAGRAIWRLAACDAWMERFGVV